MSKEVKVQSGITLQDLIVYNIQQTISAFNEMNNCNFECGVNISGRQDNYSSGFGNVVAPRREHILEITLTER